MSLDHRSRAGSRDVVIAVAAAVTMLLGSAVALSHRSSAQTRLSSGTSSTIDFVAPAAGTQLVRQPDGSLIRATMTAATQGGLFETVRGGYSIARDAHGYYRYVSGRTSSGVLQLTNAVVGKDQAPASLHAHAGRRTVKVDPTEQTIRDSIQRQLQIASYNAQVKAAASGKPRVYRVPALLLATWWDPSKGQTSPQFQAGHGPAFFKRLLSGFGGNPRGSVTQFYWESSFGQLLVKIDVYGPFTSLLSLHDRCWYGGLGTRPLLDDPIGSVIGTGGGGAIGMALEAVPQADPVVNFAKYDNNGDGKVDFLIILHSGADEAVTSDDCNTWSHASQVTLGLGATLEQTLGLTPGTLERVGLPTTDGVTVDRVLTIPEFESAADPLTIGVASHEMAHSLGEPDYYDTTYNSAGTGDYDIMSGGSYLGNPSGSNPALMNPATRVFQGWLKPRIVHSSLRHVTLQPRSLFPTGNYSVHKTDPNLLLVPTYEVKLGGKDRTGHTWTQFDVTGLAKDPKTKAYVVEGYYVENVSRMAHAPAEHSGETRGAIFDRKQHSSGLLVWHFDYWKRSNTLYGDNDGQSDANRYQMDVEEFDQNDNTQDLQLNYSRGNPSDLLQGAATGITSGTRLVPPHAKKHRFSTKGAADTWSNWTHRPTGWAFTNVGPRSASNGLDVMQDSSRNNAITLDVMNLKGQRDVSPGFVASAANPNDGTGAVSIGQSNRMSLPVFSNGSKGVGSVTVTVREGSANGRLIVRRDVRLGGYQRKALHFTYRPKLQGPFDLYATVDPHHQIHEADEADEDNNTQLSEGWAGPRIAGIGHRNRVLVVDDDGLLTQERVITGALATLGVPYAVVTEHPTYGQLHAFGAVIWEAANDRGSGQLDPADLNAVTRYLKSGGQVMFDSNRIIDALGLGPSATSPQATVGMVNFAAHYLGTVLPDQSYVATQESVVKVSGHGLLDGVDGRIAPEMGRPFLDFGGLSSGAATSQGASVHPYGHASGLVDANRADFPAIRVTAKPWLGTAVDGDAKHHHFKTVTLGFNLGQATNADLAVDVVQRVVRHFGIRSHQESMHSDAPVIYDAVVRDQVSDRPTPITAIVVGRRVGTVTLHYRTHGTATYRVMPMTAGHNHGVFTATIPGRFVTPDGVDYFIQAGSPNRRAYSPALASTHHVAHAIGVQLPEVKKRG